MPDPASEALVEAALARLDLAGRIGQLCMLDGRELARSPAATDTQVERDRIGCFLNVMGAEAEVLRRRSLDVTPGIAPLFAIDAIHGNALWPGATVFPSQLALAAAWNPGLVEWSARVTARETAATGARWTFSPVLCLSRDLRFGRIGETFGEDPVLAGSLGRAMIRGLEAADDDGRPGLAACAKHLAGYAETAGGRDADEAELPRRKLERLFLPPFLEAVEEGVRTVMTAYCAVDGVPATVNRWLLGDVLRERFGFDGVVVTDWDTLTDLVKRQRVARDLHEAVERALAAGVDVAMSTPDFPRVLAELVETGRVSAERVELSCRRVLRLKAELGLLGADAAVEIAPERVDEIGCDAHRALAAECAEQAIVMVENRRDAAGRPVLPLGPHVRRIAVVGPLADDARAQLGDWSVGSGQVGAPGAAHPRHLVTTVLDGLRDRAGLADGVTVEHVAALDLDDPAVDGIDAARDAAHAADVVVAVVGDTLGHYGEARDRMDLRLPGRQLELLAELRGTATPLVVVVIGGGPFAEPWLATEPDAVLLAFHPGMEGGTALARLLFGDVSPSGKLPVAVPRHVGQQPVAHDALPGRHAEAYVDGSFEPLWVFGHGLSYGRFAHGVSRVNGVDPPREAELAAGDAIDVEIRVTNESDRAATEVVQLYLRDEVSSVTTPLKRLVAFERVDLEAGETRTLRLRIPARALELVDARAERVTEPGAFELLVGGSSADAQLVRARFHVRG